MGVNFVHLAGGTTFNICGDKVFHIGPPVMWLNEGKSFQNSGVACCWRGVKCEYHPLPKAVVFHDNKGIIVVEIVILVEVKVVLVFL